MEVLFNLMTLKLSDNMKFKVCLYLVILLVSLAFSVSTIYNYDITPILEQYVFTFISVSVIYIGAHFLRILRLVLLTLNDRKNITKLIIAHIITALPSLFIPFKLGEILRLSAFVSFHESKEKAIAIWLIERAGDLIIITFLLLFIYLFNISIPSDLNTLLVIFLLSIFLCIICIVAISTLSIYLNRNLVLSSLSTRSLYLLRMSHKILKIEFTIRKAIEGRTPGFILLSIFIWVLEASALQIFINIKTGDSGLEFFKLGLKNLLFSNGVEQIDIYKPIALLALVFIFSGILSVVIILRGKYVNSK